MIIKYFAPSYRRPQKSITQDRYPFITLVIAENEAAEYKKKGCDDFITCPNKVQGNISRVRNWILDNNKDADCIVVVDDDCTGIGKWYEQDKRYLDVDEFKELCEIATVMCYDMNIKLWGVNCVTDKGGYREHTPFSFVSYIGSPFMGHCKTKLRFDESLPLKEDYYFTLQNLNVYRKVLRFNAYNYEVKQAEQQGGCSTIRTSDKEKQQFELLQRKWGASIVQRDYKSKRSFDFNPVLKIPIRGV